MNHMIHTDHCHPAMHNTPKNVSAMLVDLLLKDFSLIVNDAKCIENKMSKMDGHLFDALKRVLTTFVEQMV